MEPRRETRILARFNLRRKSYTNNLEALEEIWIVMHVY